MMQNGYRTPPSLAPLTLEVQEKLNLSAAETEGLSLREVKCPHCGFVITKVFSDMCGHYLARCRKCKREQPIFGAPKLQRTKEFLARILEEKA